MDNYSTYISIGVFLEDLCASINRDSDIQLHLLTARTNLPSESTLPVPKPPGFLEKSGMTSCAGGGLLIEWKNKGRHPCQHLEGNREADVKFVPRVGVSREIGIWKPAKEVSPCKFWRGREWARIWGEQEDGVVVARYL